MLLNLTNSSSLFGVKRKLESFLSCSTVLITLFILSFLINSNHAGVIKRDTDHTETPSGNIVVNNKETEVATFKEGPLQNDSVAILSSQLQTKDIEGLVTETSKELSNNEILINEAKKLLEDSERIKQTNNESLTKSRGEEVEDQTKVSFQDSSKNTQTLVSKAPNLQELAQASQEFSSNDIKEEKNLKSKEKEVENSKFSKDDAIKSKFLESEIKNGNRNSKAEQNNGNEGFISVVKNEEVKISNPSMSETEINQTEKPLLDNSIEHSQKSEKLKLQNKVVEVKGEQNTLKPWESTTLKTLVQKEGNMLESTADIYKIKEGESMPSILETSTFEPKVTESLKAFSATTEFPFKDSDSENQIRSADYSVKKEAFDKQQELKRFPTTQSIIVSSAVTTLRPSLKEEEELLVFEGDKKEYARSMSLDEITTLKFVEQEEVTTYKPTVIISIKEGIKEVIPELKQEKAEMINSNNNAPLNLKEKKPKFINDNSTNAQQLNLPNNAEVWSLAAMKSLPKTNITIETAPAHNETFKEANSQQNSSLILNNNSEKNLLDWSQIMMDKDLAVTTRNEEINANIRKDEVSNEEPKSNDNNYKQETSLELQFEKQPEEQTTSQIPLVHEQDTTTTTTLPIVTTTNTFLSTLSNKENYHENLNLADKKVEENMNNHIETLTATFASTKVDNNPLNTTLNIEPNLNEINLTSNQSKVDTNNNKHTTTTALAEKQTEIDDVKANVNMHTETSTQSTATTTLTMSTTTMSAFSTTATAVYDDMSTVEQISSETTTVSILETLKQNASFNNVVISEQQQEIKNKTYNVNKLETNTALHNELEDNYFVDKNQLNSYAKNELITPNIKTTTTTVIPITTFRPTILAITYTTSKGETFEQEVDQKNNEIQTNLTNTQQQQSIIEFGLQHNNHTSTAQAILYDTTTIETLTTPSTPTEILTTAASKITNTHTTSFPWENETYTTTPSSKDVLANETTTIQTTPKIESEQKHEVDEENKGNATGSAVSIDKKFENQEYQTTTTTVLSKNETISLANSFTETPVVISTEKEQQMFVETTTTTETSARSTTFTTEQNLIATTSEQTKNSETQENITKEEEEDDVQTSTQTNIIMNNTQETTTISASLTSTTTMNKEEETYISLLDEKTTTTTTQATIQPNSTTIPTTTTSSSYTPTTTTPTSLSTSSSSYPIPQTPTTLPLPNTTKVEEIYNIINSSTTELIQTTTQLITEIAPEKTNTKPASATTTTTTTISYLTEMLPPATTTTSTPIIPTNDIARSLPTLTTIMGGNSGNMYTKNSQASGETDVNVIIAITVSVIGVIALILLVGFLYLMRKRQKQTSYSQRCRPVSLDEYTIDNASVGGSMRKSNTLRTSKRTYGNLAFDDPALRHNPMGVQELAKFVQEKLRIFEEFRDVPQITSRLDEVPTGCEDKNRYANVLPLPETRVILQRLNDDEKSEYINANYVTGPKDPPNYYIACQAPLESTVEDFWRMIWEQQSRVIIQATDLIENGVEKCAEYLPPSVTLDNHSSFGDFQITLQNREVKDKYAISTLLLKHVGENATRELTHYWYKWPETGVPAEEAPIIAMLLEARSSLISYAIEQANEDKEKSSTATLKSAEEGTVPVNNSTTASTTNNSNGSSNNGSTAEINGNISMVHIKKAARNQGPLTVHCSPGTGRTGTIISCDIALRSLETPKRTVDIPQIVYYVRRGRASAVLTKEQYEFIYKVANMYAAKITNPTNYN